MKIGDNVKLNKLISLLESYTGKKVVLKENTKFKNNGPAVKMTTKQFERNPNEVKRITDKGLDIELTDLRENEFDNYDEEMTVEAIYELYQNGNRKDAVKEIVNYDGGAAEFFQDFKEWVDLNIGGNKYEEFAQLVMTYFRLRRS